METSTPGRPVRLDLQAPLEVANWRPLIHWLLGIPQLLIAGVLRYLRNLLTIIALFIILFTAKIPRGLFDVIVMTHRYGWRAKTYVMFMRESYPPFDFKPVADDTGDDPAGLSIERPETLNRWLPLVKWLLAIPHYIVLALLYVATLFAWIVAFFAVLFTGKWPEGIRDFLVGVVRWSLRVQAYVGLLRDEYPPFSLS